jgi:ribose transport system permease protein
MSMPTVLRSVRGGPWLVPVIGAVALLVPLVGLSHDGPGALFGSNAYGASFIVVAALGQMIVVASGRGAIDLSIPQVITLCAYVATVIQHGSNSALLLSIPITLLLGGLVGAVNGLIVVGLRIPAMVATLAVGFIAQSIAQVISSSHGHSGTSPALANAARGHVAGISLFTILAVLVAAAVGLLLHRTGLGAQLLATGQSDQAARGAGVRLGLVRLLAFVASGILSALAALMLCGYSGGASLGMGTSFLISSIAAVVLGGTVMSGGRVSAGGILAGAFFLTLLVTLINTIQVPAGSRLLIPGLVILAALVIGPQVGSKTLKGTTA